MKKLLLAALAATVLAGCSSMNVTMMPRDSGKLYAGKVNSEGDGAGTMTVAMEGGECAGPVVRVASNQTFGFANTFGVNGRGASASALTAGMTDGDSFAKAMLTCPGGKGLRCDVSGRSGKGGGICVDDAGRIYDVVMRRG